MSRRAARSWLLAAGTVLGLLASEVGLRAHSALTERRMLAAWRALGTTTYRPGQGRAHLGHLIRPHADPEIVYELIPNLSLDFAGAHVTTNPDGFRGPLCPKERAGDAARIVGIGDSVMFGWGVADGECFLEVLARRLEALHPGTRFETVNTAVPGYNTAMQVATLREKGLAWQPDLVIVDFVGNDLSLPNFIAPESETWSLARCFLLDALRSALDTASRRPRRPLVPSPWHDEFQFEFDPERVPDAYRGMVGLEAWSAAMRELAELGREHGFAVVASTHLRAPDFLRETCAELDFPLVEMQPRLTRALAELGATDRGAAGLTASPTDPHPSALAHRLQAEELECCLADTGILGRLPRERGDRAGR